MGKTTKVVVEFNHFGILQQIMREAIGDIAEEIAEEVVEDVKADMAASGGGRVYGTHVASAPGEAPAIDVGLLAASYGSERVKPHLAAVFSKSFKAPWLEFGLKGGRLAARPALRKAVKDWEREFMNRLANIEGRMR